MTQATAAAAIPDDLSKLEAEAAKVLSPEALAYILAGAGDRSSTRANAAAFRRWKIKRRWRIVPRMFIDRAERDLSTTVLGVAMPAPVILGPIGRQTLAHPDGEAATAKAAADLGLTNVHSSRSSMSVERVAVAAPAGSRWFGLDWPKGERPDAALLTRARLTGCTHLVLSPPAARAGLGGAPGDPQRLGRADRPRRHPDRAGRADGGPPCGGS